MYIPLAYTFLDILFGSIMLILSLVLPAFIIVFPLYFISESRKSNRKYTEELNEERQRLLKQEEELLEKEWKIKDYKEKHSQKGQI